jgi:uncharacterized protein (TIGR03067 family)
MEAAALLRRIAMPTVLVLAVLLLLPLAARGEAPSAEKLAGTWRLVSTADALRVTPGCGECTMRIDADGTVTLKAGERTLNEGTLRLHCAGRAPGTDAATLRVPGHIDLKLATGRVLGVYERKDNELRICCDGPGKPRPACMKPAGTQWVERWCRVKPPPLPCGPGKAEDP